MRKKSKIILLVIILIIIIPLIGIGLYLASLKEPDVEIRDIQYKSFDPETSTIIFLVTVDVDNPNNINVRLLSLKTQVYIDGEFVGYVNQDIDKEIKAGDNTSLVLDFVLYDVPVIQSQIIEVRVTGIATVKVSFLTFSVPIDKTQEVNIREELNQAPTAVIIHDAGLVEITGREITFDGGQSRDSDGDVELYEWDFGDGSPKEYGQTVRHAYQSRGQYIVELIVYDNWNASGTDTANIRVVGF